MKCIPGIFDDSIDVAYGNRLFHKMLLRIECHSIFATLHSQFMDLSEGPDRIIMLIHIDEDNTQVVEESHFGVHIFHSPGDLQRFKIGFPRVCKVGEL